MRNQHSNRSVTHFIVRIVFKKIPTLSNKTKFKCWPVEGIDNLFINVLESSLKQWTVEIVVMSVIHWGNCFSLQCFMNSILQCLSNTHSLRDYCLHNSHRRDLNNNSRTNTALMEGERRVTQAPWSPKPLTASQTQHAHSCCNSLD